MNGKKKDGNALPAGDVSEPRVKAVAEENNLTNQGAGILAPMNESDQNSNGATSEGGADQRSTGDDGNPVSGKRKSKPGPKGAIDPFWGSEIVPILERDVDSKVTGPGILDHLMRKFPGAFDGKKRKSMLQTLGRRVRNWRQKNGRPAPEGRAPKRKGRRRKGDFPQDHPPGREAQVDFTHCERLEVTIGGEAFPHQLFDLRMSHSGWVHAEVFEGETLSGLMEGLRNSFEALGGVPEVVRSDNRRNAIRDKKPVEPYRAFLKHYGVQLTLINHYRPHENGGVEGENGRLKAAIEQELLIRDCRDFASKDDYRRFVKELVDWRNQQWEIPDKLKAEQASLRQLPSTPAPVHVSLKRKVRYPASVIEVYTSKYSVPYEYVGQKVTVRLYAEHLEVYDRKSRKLIAQWDRKHGNGQYSIDPYHVAGAMLSKPGSLDRLQKEFKEHMFPRESFKLAYDRLKEWDAGGGRTGYGPADFEYLRILCLVGEEDRKEDEDRVDEALRTLLDGGVRFGYQDVKKMVRPGADVDKVDKEVTGQPTLWTVIAGAVRGKFPAKRKSTAATRVAAS